MKKKLVAGLLTGAMMAALLTGCAGSGSDKSSDAKESYTIGIEADMGTAGQISDSFVSDKVDLICAIATPSAQSAYNAAMDAGIPVIYTAVTDPVAAELADKDGNPVKMAVGPLI